MSGQAQDAVTFHSKQTGKQLKLMHILASCANDNLIISPAPSHKSIAGIMGYSDRYLRTQLIKLYDAGELEMVRKGSRGKPSIYKITLSTLSPFGSQPKQLPSSLQEQKSVKSSANQEIGGTTGTKNDGNRNQLAELITGVLFRLDKQQEQMSELAEQIKSISGTKSANSGTTGTNKRNNVVEEVSPDPFDPLDPKDSKTPPTPSKFKLPKGKKFPEKLKTPLFLEKWDAWEIHRREKKSSLTPSTRMMQLKKCTQYSLDDIFFVIDASIHNGWTGLFWEKLNERPSPNGHGPTNAGKPKPPPRQETTIERIRRVTGTGERHATA